MRLIIAIIGFIWALNVSALGIEIPRAGFGYQKAIILFDLSANVLTCKQTLKREFKVLDQLLSTSSLKKGGVNAVSFIFFDKEVLGTSTVEAKEHLFKEKDFKEFSEQVKRNFASFYRKTVTKSGNQLADLYGALVYSLSLVSDRKTTIIVVSPGIQNFNRDVLTSLQLPENVKRVFFLSHPFECTSYSESYKYKAFQTYVVDYWKRLISPISKVEFLYSF